MRKKIIHFLVLFAAGGLGYVLLELLYRKKSHVSMFIDGGICLYFIDLLCNRARISRKLSIFVRGLISSALITCVELVTGLIVNKRLKLKVWDYSRLPLNLYGQVCAGYSLLWFLLSIPVIAVCKLVSKKLVL